MWARKYKDYPPDSSLKQQTTESGKGIIGCEMHELFGWGEQHHIPKKKKGGTIRAILMQIFGKS